MLLTLLLMSGCGDAPVRSGRSEKAAGDSASADADATETARVKARWAALQESDVRLAFVGDILLGSRVAEAIERQGAWYPWAEVAPILSTADVAVGNLESAVGEPGTAWKPVEKRYTFLATPASLAGARGAGLDVLSLANNHVLDYGARGLAGALAAGERWGLALVGAGTDATAAWQPVAETVAGLRVSLLGTSHVVPWTWAATDERAGVASAFEEERLLTVVRQMATEAELPVVLIHWGEEGAEAPEEWQVELAHRLIDAGARLVIGTHPHVWQGLEAYHGGLIAYSLGNFVFTLGSQESRRSAVLTVYADRQGTIDGLRVTPVHLELGHTVPVTGEEAARFWSDVNERSRPLAAPVLLDGEGRWLAPGEWVSSR